MVFRDEEQLTTKKILAELCLIEDGPWNDLKGKAITNNQLARRLGQYGVKPKTLRLAGDHFAKGLHALTYMTSGGAISPVAR
jgi:hypothetical protein